MLCMAHITLSVPDEVHKEMKHHPEIKWSEIARQSIIEKTLLLKKSMNAGEFFRLLSPDTQKEIKSMTKKEGKKFYEEIKKKEWKRAKYLIQT